MENREALKQKYGDEQVLVVPKELLAKLGLEKEGYNSNDMLDMAQIIISLEENSYFIPRWKSDENPDEVELIAYVTFGNPDLFFTYKRIKNGDARGDGKLSIGVGGHINPCDEHDALVGIVSGSALREVKEETGVELDYFELEPEGFIRCTQTAFDRDHLGIHFNVGNGIYQVAEEDKMLPLGMVTTRALKELFYDKLENWTKIIIDEQ